MAHNIKSFQTLLVGCKVEADVRAAYAKFFDIPFDTSEYIDLYTPQVLFEFKYDRNLTRTHEKARILAQALYYVRWLRYGDIDELQTQGIPKLFSKNDRQDLLRQVRPVPPFICLADVNEAILTPTETWQTYITDENECYNWTLSPSNPDDRLVLDLADTALVQTMHTYDLANEQEMALFVKTLSNALSQQTIDNNVKIKKQITEKNFEQVYRYWDYVFGGEVRNGYKPSRYFVSDIQAGNTKYLSEEGKALFYVDGKFIPKKILRSDYDWFWSLFDKVRNMDTIRGILAKADRLTDDSLRRFHGEFFTPIPFATKALDYIAETIGQEWWKSGEYRLWDMAAGTGNLEYNLPASAWKYCYLSTLEETDVEHLKRLFPDANIFQYNYLDDDVDVITQKVRAEKANEKSLENLVSYHKLPENLVVDLNNPNIKWIIFINPPFGTSQAGGNTAKRENKAGIHNTNIRRLMHECNLGEVSRELFSQFLFRIKYEFTAKNAHLVLFSTLKYINATNDTKFRNNIFQFEFVRGFVFSSVNFSGTAKGNGFPVGCILWNLSKSINLNNQKIILDVLSNNTSKVSSKRIEVKDKSKFLSNWIKRPSCTHIFPPFSSAITIKPGNKDKRDRIADGFVGCLRCAGNDFQCLNLTFLLSGPAVSAGALSVTAENFEQAVVVHAARRIPQSTWINDRDQFLAPQKDLSTEFITDCAVWSLFADSNQTAALKDVEYEGTIYQIHNHFFPFPVSEIKQWTISDPDIRQTLFSAEDTFVCRWLKEHVLSKEAQTLLLCGKEIYRFYFAHLNALRTTKFKIATWDAGWYQIRMALKNADLAADLIAELKEHHRLLRLKLLPQLTQYSILN